MHIPDSIFRQYDIRGVVGTELTGEFAHALGRAWASLATATVGHAPTVAIGRDNRPSGVELAGALRDGLVAGGATAIDVGELPTPGPTGASRSRAPTTRPSSTGSRWCSAARRCTATTSWPCAT